MGFGRRKLVITIVSFFCAALFFFWSCASTGSFAAVDGELGRGGYAGSVAQLEKNKNALYKSRDTILYYLDKGMLSHYAQDFAGSSQLLEAGERAIEDAFTRSVTQGIAAYLVNDNARDYGGEDYEDIYINAFNALNYYRRGQLEGAMVEIRRMNDKLQHLSFKYDTAISDIQKKAMEDGLSGIPQNPNAPSKFNNSALARYLGMLFYRGAGLHDDARIDRDWLLAAFANAPSVYSHPVPSSLSGELNVPRNMARLNVIAFSGLSPVKKENVARIPLPNGRWIKIALPEMVSRRSDISRVELVFDSGGSFELELLENIDAVAKEAFKARQQLIYLRTIIRAIIKTAGSSALQAAAEEKEGDSRTTLEILSILTQIYADVSERADIRVSRYFPARAYIGGINLPPGRYSFQIKYYNRNRKVIASVWYKDMIVRENILNLAEAVCLN